jgi:hypothetical protein
MTKLTRLLLRTGLELMDFYDTVAGIARHRVEDIKKAGGRVFPRTRGRASRNVISFATGAGIGLSVGLLLAPARGEHTRRKIFNKVGEIGSNVRERKPPQSTIKQPSGRRLDKEAVSRMDDEGGTPDAAVNPPDAAGKAGLGG